MGLNNQKEIPSHSDWWKPEGNIWTTTHYLPFTEWEDRTNQEISVLLPLLQDAKTVLDAPTGFGRHALSLAMHGFQVTGIDINQDLIELASNTARLNRLDSNASFLSGNLLSLPFEQNKFDAVINMFSSFGYLETRKADFNVLKEFSRVVKEGGKVIFDLANPYGKLPHFQSDWESTLNNGMHIKHSAQYDSFDNAIIENRIYTDPEGNVDSGTMRIRLYAPHEMIELGKLCGLEPVELLSKDGSEYKLSSGRYWLGLQKQSTI